MQFNWEAFLLNIQDSLACQNQKIAQLELLVSSLKAQLEKIKERGPIQIEHIEYKFDQLKIEKLEGTLNIGLNPSDVETLEELSVNNENPLSPYMFDDREKLVQNMTNDATKYLTNEKPAILKRAASALGKQIDEQVANFIIEDLMRQIPYRINAYLDQTPIYDRTTDRLPKVTEKIMEKIFSDIDSAILNFLSDNAKNSNE